MEMQRRLSPPLYVPSGYSPNLKNTEVMSRRCQINRFFFSFLSMLLEKFHDYSPPNLDNNVSCNLSLVFQMLSL